MDQYTPPATNWRRTRWNDDKDKEVETGMMAESLGFRSRGKDGVGTSR
jgi:hypothetical protein